GGSYIGPSTADGGDGFVKHRIEFWPRTDSPVLLIANRSAEPAQYGLIRLLRQTGEMTSEAVDTAVPSDAPQRTVANYLANPRFALALGAQQTFDAATGLSIDSWQTFLDGSRRLVQRLRLHGYNAAVVCIAAEGSSLSPLSGFGQSPRYDNGAIAASVADPVRKDVLEALLRIFDREGLKLLPAIELAAPTPPLEELRRAAQPSVDGVDLVNFEGRTADEIDRGRSGLPSRYSLLHPQVQDRLRAALAQFTERYAGHPSLAGLALQIPSDGYGALPDLAWGMSDATCDRFVASTGVPLPHGGDQVFLRRAQLLGRQHRNLWRRWRADQVSRFYAEVAQSLRNTRQDLQLL
ncbi:MAG: hypothetical protein AAF961_19520, partial [Planctomycetota bacterium]